MTQTITAEPGNGALPTPIEGAVTKAPSPNGPLAERLFREFDRRGVRYCVLRNFLGLPQLVGGDMDILVHPQDLGTAEQIVHSVRHEHLIVRREVRNDHVQYQVVSALELERACREQRAAEGLAIDFQTRLQYKGLDYLDAEAVLSERARFGRIAVCGPRHHAAHVACHAMLDKNAVKPEYRDTVAAALSAQGAGAFTALEPFVGPAMAERLAGAWESGNETSILKTRGALIAGLVRSRPRALLSAAAFHWRKVRRIARALVCPPGVLVTTAGPDGVGKTTLLEQVHTVLSGNFVLVHEQYMGWKDFILPTKKVLGALERVLKRRPGSDGPPSHSEARSPGSRKLPWTHNLSVLHYVADLWARYVIRIRPVLGRGGLVLCDRYFYDLLVRNVWVCRNRWSRAALCIVAPRPSVTVLFHGDPQVISARKDELTPAEVKLEMDRFADLKSCVRGGSLVDLDATAPLGENVLHVVRAIVDAARKEGFS